MERFHELLKLITDESLRNKTLQCYETALKEANQSWKLLEKMPFTLLIANCNSSFLDHIERVVHLALAIANEMKNFSINRNFLVAGAILHDVGKILTITEDENGHFKRKELAIFVPYNVLGAHLALEHKLPPQVVHIVLAHASEYEGKRITEEALIVSEVDRLLFELAKTHARSVIWHHG